MDDSGEFATQGLKGLQPLPKINHTEWRDVMEDYLDSQNWIKFSKEGLPANADEALRFKPAKIAFVLNSAAGSQRTFFRTTNI